MNPDMEKILYDALKACMKYEPTAMHKMSKDRFQAAWDAIKLYESTSK